MGSEMCIRDRSSGMNSGIGATGGHAVHRPEGIQGCDRVIKDALNAGALTLPLPTAKKRPLVLKTEGNASWTIALKFSQEVSCGSLGNADTSQSQTSSMMAISALSPRRRTVRVMRV